MLFRSKVHHIDGHDHRQTDLHQLCRKVEVTFQIRAIDDIQDDVRLFVHQIVSGDFFFECIRRKGIDPRQILDDDVLVSFEEAEIAKFTPQEMREYEASKMAYRDIKNSIDTAKREGKIEANTETAQRLLAMGLSPEQVAKATLLPLKIIENLRNS